MHTCQTIQLSVPVAFFLEPPAGISTVSAVLTIFMALVTLKHRGLMTIERDGRGTQRLRHHVTEEVALLDRAFDWALFFNDDGDGWLGCDGGPGPLWAADLLPLREAGLSTSDESERIFVSTDEWNEWLDVLKTRSKQSIIEREIMTDGMPIKLALVLHTFEFNHGGAKTFVEVKGLQDTGQTSNERLKFNFNPNNLKEFSD